MTKETLERNYPPAVVAAKLALERDYEAAVAAKIAAGPEHADDPDCDCLICDEERELYFIDKHFLDDVVPLVHDPRPVNPETDRTPGLTDEDIPF